MMSMAAAVRWLAERDPDRPAVTHGTTTLTRLELDRRTNRLARAYQGLGVTADRLVTIGLGNGIGFIEACIAAWKLGATPQPVSSRLPRRELDAIVELAGPALVVGADPADHAGRTVVDADFAPDPALDDGPLPDAVASSWKAPTSGGSTGRPKIIVDGNPSMIDPETGGAFGLEPDGVLLVPGPLYHNGPFMFSLQGLLKGNHTVVMTRFDAAETLRLVEQHRVQWTLLVPTMMSRIWKLPEPDRLAHDLSSLEAILHLAAPCPAWLKEAWIEWLGPEKIWELYAGTEAQGVTVISGTEWLEHRGSVGRPVIGEFEILDEAGETVPAGEVGEVWIRPPEGLATYRYIGADARERDGWESLGDMGWLDDDGYLYLADRQTDMILAGGANIYPAEIEAALEEHPAVGSCAVIGLPDDDLGNVVHAVVQEREPVTDDELREHLADRLVRYKIPRSFERVAGAVRDDAGKVRRSALRAERAAGPG